MLIMLFLVKGIICFCVNVLLLVKGIVFDISFVIFCEIVFVKVCWIGFIVMVKVVLVMLCVMFFSVFDSFMLLKISFLNVCCKLLLIFEVSDFIL